MPETKKATKPKSPSKQTKKPAPKAKPAVTKKPETKVVKPAPKPQVKPAVPEVKVKKTRGPNKKSHGSFAELLKIQSQYEEAKKGAKSQLRKEYEAHLKEADKLKATYKEMFNESIDSAPKAKVVGVKKTAGKVKGLKAFTLKEVEDFVDQKKSGVAIKIQGRRPKSIARMEEAYKKTEKAEEILEILNK